MGLRYKVGDKVFSKSEKELVNYLILLGVAFRLDRDGDLSYGDCWILDHMMSSELTISEVLGDDAIYGYRCSDGYAYSDWMFK